jgi:methyl-accepting chemotaxis protein
MNALHSVAPLGADERAELAAHRALTARLMEVCSAAGAGDSEARALEVPEAAAFPDLDELRHAVNRILDLADAFVREGAAALKAAGEGRYHRHVVERGFPGHFRVAAGLLNDGQAQMKASADQVVAQQEERKRLADQFESVVVNLTEQVVEAARRLSQTTHHLTSSAASAGVEVESARGTIDTLSESGRQINDVVKLIDTIAAQTRLLALNATIEAARVGEAGKGFAVVANEVKELSNQTQLATQKVGDQVELIQNTTTEAVHAMTNTGSTVQQMNGMVGEMAAAVEGDGVSEGLMRATVSLRSEVTEFLQQMRR